MEVGGRTGPTMRNQILLLALVSSLAAGCGSDLQPAAVQAAPVATQEAHQGELRLATGETLDFDFELTRSGTSLSGPARVISADGLQAIYGTLSGTETGGTHTLTVELPPLFPHLTLQGASGGGGFTGNVSGDQTGTYHTQVVTAASIPTGKLTLTLDDGTVLPLNLAPITLNPQDLPQVSVPQGPFLAYTTPFEEDQANLGGSLAGQYFFALRNFTGQLPFDNGIFSGGPTGGTYTLIPGPRQGKFTITP